MLQKVTYRHAISHLLQYKRWLMAYIHDSRQFKYKQTTSLQGTMSPFNLPKNQQPSSYTLHTYEYVKRIRASGCHRQEQVAL